MKNPDKNSLSILYVEDEEINQIVLNAILKQLGYQKLTVADNADIAIEILENPETDINFIFMDLGLPGMNGIELTKKIRQSSLDVKNIPIVALTGNTAAESKDICLAAGMNGFFEKPVDKEELKGFLEGFIQGNN